MNVRERLLDAAEAQLEASPNHDIAVRSVCEAVGVGAPMLYRLFGDKFGLLEAVTNRGFERYLSGKRDAPVSGDPVEDLRAGWDSHVRFAVTHPAVYRLMYSPVFASVPEGAGEAMRLLRLVLDRCAAAGRLRVDTSHASQAIMAANIGVALARIAQPELYSDAAMSTRVRDAVHGSILRADDASTPVPGNAGGPEAAESAVASSPLSPLSPSEATALTAVRLSAQLRTTAAPTLTDEEQALMQQWLRRLSSSPALRT